MTNLTLPPKLALLYARLEGGADVSIRDLHDLLFPAHADRDERYKQQCLGPYLTKLNRRIRATKQEVQLGLLRKHYRLVTL